VIERTAKQHACSKSKQTRCHRRPRTDGVLIVTRRFGRSRRGRRRVHDLRVVLRHVHNLRIRGLDLDDGLVVFGFGLHLLLRSRLEISNLFRLATQSLHCIQHALLIRRECGPELPGPIDVLAHHVHYGGKPHERAHRRTKTGFGRRRIQRVPLQVLVLQQPIAGIENLLRIHRCGQYLPHQLIRIECDRCN
jgi:hypothetical protein